jgi:hypothetical protein
MRGVQQPEVLPLSIDAAARVQRICARARRRRRARAARYSRAMADPTARAIVSRCLVRRLENDREPALDTLDQVLLGQDVLAADFGGDVIPPAPFALLIAAAFDTRRAEQWEKMAAADPAEQRALLVLWEREIWPRFVARYGLK